MYICIPKIRPWCYFWEEGGKAGTVMFCVAMIWRAVKERQIYAAHYLLLTLWKKNEKKWLLINTFTKVYLIKPCIIMASFPHIGNVPKIRPWSYYSEYLPKIRLWFYFSVVISTGNTMYYWLRIMKYDSCRLSYDWRTVAARFSTIHFSFLNMFTIYYVLLCFGHSLPRLLMPRSHNPVRHPVWSCMVPIFHK